MSNPPKLPAPNLYPQRTRRLFRLMTAILVLCGVLLLILVGLLTVQSSAEQLSILGNMLLICLVLLPVILCLSPLYLVIMVGIYGVFVLHNGAGSLLNRAQGLVSSASEFANTWLERAGKASIGVHARLAFIRQLLSFFDLDLDPDTQKASKASEENKPK